jgi:glycine dehydrogenase subunit 1
LNKIHPYLPNSVPEIKEKMMEKIGVSSIEDLFSDIPREFIYKKELKYPWTTQRGRGKKPCFKTPR